MTSARKEVGDLKICQEFVDSIIDCLRDFWNSIVLNNKYLLFIFVDRGRKEEGGGRGGGGGEGEGA